MPLAVDTQSISEVTTKKRKKIEYNPRAKNESVQSFLSLQPGQRITIEFETIASDEGDSLVAAVSLCDHLNRQAYSERALKVVSMKVSAHHGFDRSIQAEIEEIIQFTKD